MEKHREIFKELYNACACVSAYEVAEDLQTIALILGEQDEGWKNFASVLLYLNSHVSTVGRFPISEKGEVG